MFEELETPMQKKATCRVGLLEKRRKPAATRRMRITDATKQKHLVVVVMAGIVARATGHRSATWPTRAFACNQDVMAGFAGAHRGVRRQMHTVWGHLKPAQRIEKSPQKRHQYQS